MDCGGFGWTDHGLANIVNDYILDSAQKNHNLIPLCSFDINSKKSEEELIKCISRGVKGIGELHLEYDESFENTLQITNKINSMNLNFMPEKYNIDFLNSIDDINFSKNLLKEIINSRNNFENYSINYSPYTLW